MISLRDSEGRFHRIWAGVLAALAALWLWRRLRPDETPTGLPLDEISGLGQEEAAARYVEGQSNAISFHPPRSRKQIVRENSLTVFNIGLVAIVFVQLLLGKYLDALVSVGVLIFTIGINVFQEEFARIRLRKIMQEARPKAHIIRDGKVRSIDPDAVVVGDALAIGPGDQTVVDGELLGEDALVVDESLIFGKGQTVIKQTGDHIFAGSLCVSGRGVYRATHIGANRLIERKLEHLATAPETLTPIEKIVNRTLQLLLAFVLIIAAFLLSKFFLSEFPFSEETANLFIDAIGVIFSIAPAGLFFMIVLTYAGSTVDLMQRGALVHRARSIETLAQTDIICFGQAGFLTDDWVEMTLIPTKTGGNSPKAAEIHKMLGTFARSISMRNRLSTTLKNTYDGLLLPPADEMSLYAIYGWSAVTLENDEMRGVFVLGDPDMLQSGLHTDAANQEKLDAKGLLKQAKGLGGTLGALFRKKTNNDNADSDIAIPTLASKTQAEADAAAENAQQSAKSPFFKRWGKTVVVKLRRKKDGATVEAPAQEKAGDEAVLIFAWLPEPAPLHDDHGAPHMPDGLIPLCQLTYQQRINPDAVLALREFNANGVQTTLFSSDSPEHILAALRSVGVTENEANNMKMITGEDLAALDEPAFAEAVNDHHIFGNASPALMASVVQTMRETGHRVGVVGGGVNEIHAMRNADISLTTITASSGALSIADIVLLETSPAVTARIIDKGQRIVNGLLDVLKLYLTQALYLLILIIVLLYFLHGFPYQGAQGGLIAAFAISIPAIAITLTAPAGRLNTRRLGWHLAIFVLPAGISIALAGYIIYAHFLHLYSVHAAAQLALVHGLVFIGLLLAVLIRPPIFFTTSINTIARNLLTPIVAAISGLIFYLVTQIPLAQQFTKITPLRTSADYYFIGLTSLAWAALFAAYLFMLFGVQYFIGFAKRRSIGRASSS